MNDVSCKNILLLGIQSADLREMIRLLVHEGYKALHYTLDEYKLCGLIDEPQLIIVDCLYHGTEVISKIRRDLSITPNNIIIRFPPILALVDIGLTNKEIIYQLGAIDYLSCPIIRAELRYRIERAINCVTFFQKSRLHHQNSKQAPGNIADPGRNLPRNCRVRAAEHALAEKTANYLNTHLSNEVNLDDLSREMMTNRNKLSKAFKGCFHTTMFVWLREQRMFYAVELLRSTSHSILNIAEKVGFTDSNNFSTAFKKKYELSPMQFRKELRNNSIQ